MIFVPPSTNWKASHHLIVPLLHSFENTSWKFFNRRKSVNINSMDVILDHSFGGINSSIPGIGGPQCVKFLPLWQRIAETFLLVPLAICGIIISSKNLQPFLLPISGKMLSSINESAVMFDDDKNLVRYCVLAFYCFIFGSEIVCKLVRRYRF